jgi:hypothetical protein
VTETLRTAVLVRSQLLEGDTEDFLVSTGFRVVVTNIDCSAGSSGFAPLLGFEDLSNGATWLYLAVAGVIGQSAQWAGRQAFDAGSGFRMNAHVFNWDIRVTGWILALP